VGRQFSGVIISGPSIAPPLVLESGDTFVRVSLSIWPQQLWIVDQQLVPRIRETLKVREVPLPNDRIAVFYHAREQLKPHLLAQVMKRRSARADP